MMYIKLNMIRSNLKHKFQNGMREKKGSVLSAKHELVADCFVYVEFL